jgi:primosomal protein N' (replication factor Y)
VKILLGTQMIAKGLDFPNVTLVGVIDADTILHQPDLRASERTFQLIAQVAGRTGRGELGGRVLVQTSSPAEPAILQAAEHDFISFAEQELGHRKGRNVPPFEHLARVILRGPEEPMVQQSARDMAKTLQQTAEEIDSTVRVLGPAPAPLTRLKSLFRYHLQLAHVEFEEIQRLWKEAIGRFPRSKDVEFVIDVDPYNMR